MYDVRLYEVSIVASFTNVSVSARLDNFPSQLVTDEYMSQWEYLLEIRIYRIAMSSSA